MEKHFIDIFSTVSIIDVLAVIIVLAALGRGFYALIDKLYQYKKDAEERVQMSHRHEADIEEIKEDMRHVSKDISSLTEQVSDITDTLNTMKSQTDTTEMIKYQDRLVSLYKHYKKIGYWNEVERNSFNNMYNDYISRGGNSFVKETIKPYMETLMVKTMAQIEAEELQEN